MKKVIETTSNSIQKLIDDAVLKEKEQIIQKTKDFVHTITSKHKSELSEQEKFLNEAYINQSKTIERQCVNVINTLKDDHASLITKLKERNNSVVSGLRNRYENKIEEKVTKIDSLNQVLSAKEKANRYILSSSNLKKRNILQKHREITQKLREVETVKNNTLDTTIKSVMAFEKNKYKAKLYKLKAEENFKAIELANKNKLILSDALVTSEKKHSQELSETILKYEKIIREVIEKKDNHIALREEEINQKHSLYVAGINSQHNKIVKSLKIENEEKLSKLRDDNLEVIEKEHKINRDDLNSLEMKHSKDIEKMQAQHAIEIELAMTQAINQDRVQQAIVHEEEKASYAKEQISKTALMMDNQQKEEIESLIAKTNSKYKNVINKISLQVNQLLKLIRNDVALHANKDGVFDDISNELKFVVKKAKIINSTSIKTENDLKRIELYSRRTDDEYGAKINDIAKCLSETILDNNDYTKEIYSLLDDGKNSFENSVIKYEKEKVLLSEDITKTINLSESILDSLDTLGNVSLDNNESKISEQKMKKKKKPFKINIFN